MEIRFEDFLRIHGIITALWKPQVSISCTWRAIPGAVTCRDSQPVSGSPARFEAGTGNIADAVGLGAALDYVSEVGMENIAAYEHELLNYGTAKLLTVPGLRLIGTAREKAGVMSFVLDDARTEDVGVALNQEGIAVRSGHHCAQPILRRMGVESTVRPSLAFYNTCEDIDALVAALLRLQAGRGHRRL